MGSTSKIKCSQTHGSKTVTKSGNHTNGSHAANHFLEENRTLNKTGLYSKQSKLKTHFIEACYFTGKLTEYIIQDTKPIKSKGGKSNQ